MHICSRKKYRLCPCQIDPLDKNFSLDLFLFLNKYLLGKITKQNNARPIVTFSRIGSL